MKFPWVSRRAYDVLLEALERVQSERDAYRDRGDRLYDEVIARFGYEPATPLVREQVKQDFAEANKAAEEYAAALVIDSPVDGMLDESIEETVNEAVAAQETQRPS